MWFEEFQNSITTAYNVLVLECKRPFLPEQDETFFQELPAAAAVFLLRGDGEPYVSKTANLRRRLQRLLGPPIEQSKRLNLRNRVHEIEFTLTASDFESNFLLYLLLRGTFPKTYAARLRLRPAPVVKLHMQNEYPRASVTTRIGRLPRIRESASSLVQLAESRAGEDVRPPKMNLYYGPFRSRAVAEQFASDALDFFKMRRCVDDLHPDPSFPGCIYSEMKMCLAPCFRGCTDDQYHVEVARVQAFFDSAGESLARELAEQRDRASTDLAFEEAAAAHSKVEKLEPVLAQLPEIVHRIDRLTAIVVQPGAQPGTVAMFRFMDGILQGPIPFSIAQTGEPESMESRLEAAFAAFPTSGAGSATENMEHLAILKRWYYRSHRVGEIFFADEKGTWPLRRLVRGIGRVYKGEEPEGVARFSTPRGPTAQS